MWFHVTTAINNVNLENPETQQDKHETNCSETAASLQQHSPPDQPKLAVPAKQQRPRAAAADNYYSQNFSLHCLW